MDINQFSVTVRFFGILEMYAGARQKSVELPVGTDLEGLLDKLEEINPPAYRDLFHQFPDTEPFLRIMLNEILIIEINSIPLSQDDVITLLPGISGGSSGLNPLDLN
jgi:molybdopterin converting factor small subunit